MTEHVKTLIRNRVGFIVLDRPRALNSLSLEMVRQIAKTLRAWRNDDKICAVVIRSTSEKAFCAGGDIRFFYEVARQTPQGGSALLEDFFSEEYALNHLIHHYPKPYIALMDGIVMGGGMGIAQGGESNRLRIVTERTRMAMPEVNIGLFPDVGGGYFLARTSGKIGTYLGLSGEVIGAADALAAGLADVFVPSDRIPALLQLIESCNADHIGAVIHEFAAPFLTPGALDAGTLASRNAAIDTHFSHDSVPAILASLARDNSTFAEQTLSAMRKRSPLMMCVTLSQIRRGKTMTVAECLRMERTMVRHSFEQGEVIEGIRAMVIDKDNAPQWSPPSIEEVSDEMVARYFEPVWPEHAHPLRDLQS